MCICFTVMGAPSPVHASQVDTAIKSTPRGYAEPVAAANAHDEGPWGARRRPHEARRILARGAPKQLPNGECLDTAVMEKAQGHRGRPGRSLVSHISTRGCVSMAIPPEEFSPHGPSSARRGAHGSATRDTARRGLVVRRRPVTALSRLEVHHTDCGSSSSTLACPSRPTTPTATFSQTKSCGFLNIRIPGCPCGPRRNK